MCFIFLHFEPAFFPKITSGFLEPAKVWELSSSGKILYIYLKQFNEYCMLSRRVLPHYNHFFDLLCEVGYLFATFCKFCFVFQMLQDYN